MSHDAIALLRHNKEDRLYIGQWNMFRCVWELPGSSQGYPENLFTVISFWESYQDFLTMVQGIQLMGY